MRNVLVIPTFVALLMLGGFMQRPLPAEDLPTNKWVETSGTNEPPVYERSTPVWVESRERLLQWGGVGSRYRVEVSPRDDVRIFDPATGVWTSDYPSTEFARHIPGGHGAAPLGVSYYGTGGMSEGGTPYASTVLGAGVYDSKRDRLIYVMRGLVAAYEPQRKTWKPIECATEIDGTKYAGGPPVYGVSACFDPVNDEIVLFPHFAGADSPKNPDLRDVTGRVSSHLGTFRFSFVDGLWRRAHETLGTPETRAERARVLEQMASLSDAMDAAYVERGLLRRNETTAKDRIQRLDKRIAEGAERLRKLEARLDGELRVEPPARTGAPMVYHPTEKAIVMFGGHTSIVRSDIRKSGGKGGPPGALDDTWLYDCESRQWQPLQLDRRPPKTRLPQMFHDPRSERIVLITFQPFQDRDAPNRCRIWSLDLSMKKWFDHGSREFPGPLDYESRYASRTARFDVGYDPKAGVVVLNQNTVRIVPGKDGKRKKQAFGRTFVMRLELEELPASPAPEWKPEPPIVPQVIPADDPEWVARLKHLEPNQWIRPEVRPDAIGRVAASRRDWGNAAVDPVRGHVYYYGGGHSTYQVSDVAIYAVGANQWIHAVGDHDDFIPPVGWGGNTMGYLGSDHAHHQRNQYVALDGRMYVNVGGNPKSSRHGYLEAGKKPGDRWTWFYDVDRGGIWRQQRVPADRITKQDGVDGIWSETHLASPDGLVFGIAGDRTQVYGIDFPNLYVSRYDAYENTLDIQNTGDTHPERMRESRPFCLVAATNRIFLQEYDYDRNEKAIARQHTWAYDIAKNEWIDLHPKHQPDAMPRNVVYLPDQNAVYGEFNDEHEQWVYSFERNDWARLNTEGKPDFTAPYGQIVYAAKYGVLVCPRPPTYLMRPDVSRAEWKK